MESFLTWAMEQAPVIAVMGAWVYFMIVDRNYHRDRADKKDDNDKNLFEKMITAVTESTVVMKEVIEIVKGNKEDHSAIKDKISEMQHKIGNIDTKLEVINTKLHG